MKYRILVACLLSVICWQAAHARVRGVGGAISTAPNDKIQINLGANELGLGSFINVLKAGTLNLNALSDGGLLDSAGYIVGSPTSNIGLSFPSAGNAPQAFTGVQYKWVWTSDVRFKFTFNSSISGCTAVNATCTGGTITTTAGQAGSVTFTNDSANISGFFVAGSAHAHGGGSMALYRVSDEAKYQAGQIWTDEFLAAVSGLRPGTIRTMGMVNRGSANFNGEVRWSYRITPNDLTWGLKIPPGAWGGAVSGTDTYTASAAADTPGSWTDGEIFIGYVSNTNTITNPTLNIAGRGAKTILNNQGLALSVGGSNSIQTTSVAEFMYDGVLDAVLYNRTGMTAAIPIEAHIELANSVGANLWTVVGAWVNDDYVTNWAATVCSSLNSVAYFYPEYSNEVWNNSFPQTQWAYNRGLAFGFPNTNNEPSHGYYGLRVRKIMGDIIPAACSSRMSKVRRTLMFKGGETYSQVLNYRFKGADLAPVASGGQGNSTYNTWTGGANYTAKPNRPVDVVEVVGYAPYVTGSNLCLGPDVGCTPTSINAPFYQALVTAWEGGDSSTALNLIDNDIRRGTTYSASASNSSVTASGTTFSTPDAHGFTTSTDLNFSSTGGSAYSGLVSGMLYRVTSVSSAGCPGSVNCNFTIQAYLNGAPGGANINAGSAGSGTTLVGAASGRSIIKLANQWTALWEPIAAAFDADRPSGMAGLRMEWYEGNPEPAGLSAAQCTSLGISGSDCAGSIAAALLAYKNDGRAYTMMQSYIAQFFGADPAVVPTYGLMTHSKAMSNLILNCSPDYELIPNCAPATATPFQTYFGMRDYR